MHKQNRIPVSIERPDLKGKPLLSALLYFVVWHIGYYSTHIRFVLKTVLILAVLYLTMQAFGLEITIMKEGETVFRLR